MIAAYEEWVVEVWKFELVARSCEHLICVFLHLCVVLSWATLQLKTLLNFCFPWFSRVYMFPVIKMCKALLEVMIVLRKCQRPWYNIDKGSKLLGIGTDRNRSYIIRAEVVLFYTYSHIGWKLFRWIEHDLSKWKNQFGMCIHKLESFWWSTEIRHITICIGEGFVMGAS